jgi:hypothetical protein
MDNKAGIQHISDDAVPAITKPNHGLSHSKHTISPLVAAISKEQRIHAEAMMRKKIDTRLLTMIILMYIMNYLNWSNIAVVRLAGLQHGLNLSSVQYQICAIGSQHNDPHVNHLPHESSGVVMPNYKSLQYLSYSSGLFFSRFRQTFF